MLKRLFLERFIPFLARHPFLFFLLIYLYLVSPFDLLPETFAGIPGYVDDVVVALVLLHFVKKARRRAAEKTRGEPTVIETTAEIRKDGEGRP